tara:strand:+ start:237 stop:497 length:261 start_codon:yes stop_codon:yes gene_type:complete
MTLEEIKETLAREAERKFQDGLNKAELMEIRMGKPCRIRELATGEFELIGASTEDVDNPEIMAKYDRAITLQRERSGASHKFAIGV